MKPGRPFERPQRPNRTLPNATVLNGGGALIIERRPEGQVEWFKQKIVLMAVWTRCNSDYINTT